MTLNERVHAVSKFGFNARQARFLVTVMLAWWCVCSEAVCAVCRNRLRPQGERVLRQAG